MQPPIFTPSTLATAVPPIWPPGLPLPRLILVAGGPPPEFAGGIPLMPRFMLTEATAGPLFWNGTGLSGCPSATAVGCGSLLTTEADLAAIVTDWILGAAAAC